MSCEVLSERGKTLLLIEGYKFSFHKMLSANTVKRWQCASRKTSCKAFVKTEGAENIIVESSLLHNHHKVEERILNRQVLSNSVKRAAVDDINERPMKIIRKELKTHDQETITTSDIIHVRKNLHYARSSYLPKLPKNVTEFQDLLSKMKLKTNKGENFIMRNDPVHKIVVFSCESNLRFLSTLSHIYLDGTFQYCPKHFLQLFTIHGFKNGHYVPLVFCLLPNKFSTSYTLTFKYVKEECLRLGCDINPKVIFADFEAAIHVSICEVFPNSEVKGCRFHLGQAWYRKIQKLGLANEYRKKKNKQK